MNAALNQFCETIGITEEEWLNETWPNKALHYLQELNIKIAELEFKKDKYLPLVDRELDILDQLSAKNAEKFADKKQGLSTDQIKQMETLLKLRTLIMEKPVKIIREVVDARSPTTRSNEEILRELESGKYDESH